MCIQAFGDFPLCRVGLERDAEVHVQRTKVLLAPLPILGNTLHFKQVESKAERR